MNILEYAKIFQEELDAQMTIGATSGWMESNSGQVKYNGGNEVKVPSLTMDGLADYDRSSGFKPGSVSLKFRTLEMTQDRGRTFNIDAMDVNETNFLATASNVMGTFQRDMVVPEVDAYRYSKIAFEGISGKRATRGYLPTEATVLKSLKEDLYKIYDEIGEAVPLVITINTKVAKILDLSTELQKMLGVTDFKSGEVSTKVKTFDESPLIKVPSSRMYTEYEFMTGDEDEAGGGFKATGDAKQINWIITPRNTPIAVAKTDKIRIFNPDLNQNMDAYKLDYRKYHDLWILPNKVKGIYVNTQ